MNAAAYGKRMAPKGTHRLAVGAAAAGCVVLVGAAAYLNRRRKHNAMKNGNGHLQHPAHSCEITPLTAAGFPPPPRRDDNNYPAEDDAVHFDSRAPIMVSPARDSPESFLESPDKNNNTTHLKLRAPPQTGAEQHAYSTSGGVRPLYSSSVATLRTQHHAATE